MSHPKDSQNNMFMIGDIVVWGRQKGPIGTGTVKKIWKHRFSNDVMVSVATPTGSVTLYKPERSLIISRAPV